MVGKKLQLEDVVEGLQAVQLDALVVVDVGPLLLRHGEHVLGVEPLDGVHRLHHVDLALELLLDPVEGGDVAAATADQEVTAVPRVVDPEIMKYRIPRSFNRTVQEDQGTAC